MHVLMLGKGLYWRFLLLYLRLRQHLALPPSISRKIALPVVRGRLKGTRFLLASAVPAFWLGIYEAARTKAFEKIVYRGAIVFDIGAHVGFYTVLGSILTGARGRVIAFEPSPVNLAHLRDHLRLNRIRNVTVVELALSDWVGTGVLEIGAANTMGRLSSSGTYAVNVATLDSLALARMFPPPDCIKIDVEGEENRVLRGAEGLLRKHQPAILLETHGPELSIACRSFLKSLGYAVQSVDGKEGGKSNEFLAYAVS